MKGGIFILENEILKYITNNNLIEKKDKILVAVSGGPDSITLLNILYTLKDILEIELYVAHINHLIRDDAMLDAKYVEDYCKKREIPFFIKECNIKEKSKKEKLTLEEAGRIVRYDFFEETSNKYDINKIAIGHNKNDLAETLIMNVLRGAGTQGLKSISNKTGKYIRPLLNTRREDIEKYCEDQNLNPRIDSTNFENDYTRNKIRNIAIPYIKKEFNKNIIETLTRLSEIATEEQEYMNTMAKNEYEKILEKDGENLITVSSKKFSLLDLAIKRRIIFYITKKLFGSTKQIEKVHVDDIIKLIDNNIGNKFLMPNKNFQISIKKGIVNFRKI